MQTDINSSKIWDLKVKGRLRVAVMSRPGFLNQRFSPLFQFRSFILDDNAQQLIFQALDRTRNFQRQAVPVIKDGRMMTIYY